MTVFTGRMDMANFPEVVHAARAFVLKRACASPRLMEPRRLLPMLTVTLTSGMFGPIQLSFEPFASMNKIELSTLSSTLPFPVTS
jgi:hypothetical protein